MLRVKKELCVGCGLCVKNCPEQAIYMVSNCAEIDVSRCSECYTCVQVCPQGAITEQIPASSREIRSMVTSLKQKTEDVIKRIDDIRKSWQDINDVADKESVR